MRFFLMIMLCLILLTLVLLFIDGANKTRKDYYDDYRERKRRDDKNSTGDEDRE